MKTFNATYSPDDNKLRLYASSRLDPELYARVKAAGFAYAPKQELFCAPMWTPGREDLLIELCGEIDDEDKSLTERAEERADRFEDYSGKRAGEAETALDAVHSIAGRFEFGQPILVGHHSERRARKDKEKMENGMRKAVNLWETSEYWTCRAKGAIRHAKYKERADVRARRIKGLQADKRKVERTAANAQKILDTYTDPEALKVTLRDGRSLVAALLASYESGLNHETQKRIENGELSFEDGLTKATASKRATIAHCGRWIAHYAHRIAYESAMLDEQGGTVADKIKVEKGGAVRCWVGGGRGWLYVQKVNKITVSVLDNWGNGGGNFSRTVPFDKLAAVMSAAQVADARADGLLTEKADGTGFFLQDKPHGDKQEETPAERNDRLHVEHMAAREEAAPPHAAKAADFATVKDQLREGVQVVSASQLFPTPADLAARMVDIARPMPGERLLEPQVGTAAILRALPYIVPFGEKRQTGLDVVAVEINRALAGAVERSGLASRVHCGDFLACTPEMLGAFDVVLMNPPFENACDIAHIQHACGMLKPGGRLVAICANGPRQNAALRPMVEACKGLWEPLPSGTFKQSGTGVSTVLLSLTV